MHGPADPLRGLAGVRLQPHFTPRRIRALRPRVEALTTALLDELARHGTPADLIQALAVPLRSAT